MMGRQIGDQASLFYEFRLEDRVPKDHLLRRINVFVAAVLGGVRGQLKPYYSEIGRPSIDPDLMIRMLIIGYCYGLRSERKLTQEVELHLAYRWFCRLDLDDKVPHHSTFSENRLHRFRESDVFRDIFERVVAACMAAGLVKGEGFRGGEQPGTNVGSTPPAARPRASVDPDETLMLTSAQFALLIEGEKWLSRAIFDTPHKIEVSAAPCTDANAKRSPSEEATLKPLSSPTYRS